MGRKLEVVHNKIGRIALYIDWISSCEGVRGDVAGVYLKRIMKAVLR